MNPQDPLAVHVEEVEDFWGHSVKTRARFHIVIVVVSYKNPWGVHGEGPKAKKVDFFAELQGSSHQDQSGANPLGPHPLAEPVAWDVDEILGMKIINSLLRFKIIQDIFDPDWDVRVASVVESWQQHGSVLVDLEHVVEGFPPLFQLMKSKEKRMRVMVRPAQTQCGPSRQETSNGLLMKHFWHRDNWNDVSVNNGNIFRLVDKESVWNVGQKCRVLKETYSLLFWQYIHQTVEKLCRHFQSCLTSYFITRSMSFFQGVDSCIVHYAVQNCIKKWQIPKQSKCLKCLKESSH